jgi:myo-inositol catabolism protein IolC
MELGYPKNLYVLPFDHRSTFIKTFVGEVDDLDKKQLKLIADYKRLIFDGFLISLGYVKNPVSCAVMVDEDYGIEVLKASLKKKIITALPVEKSGETSFHFQYGDKFGAHIDAIKPDIVKNLVRYNPVNKKVNKDQLVRIRQLSDWCKKNNYKYMAEVLIPPTDGQLNRSGGKKENFDAKLKPALAVRMVKEFHDAGIEPDIWKIEALESSDDWHELIDTIRDDGRDDVAIIMLGRGDSFAKVKTWMNEAPRHLLNGFAVGRTVFLRPLTDFHQGKISKKEAEIEIAKNYVELIRYWEK